MLTYERKKAAMIAETIYHSYYSEEGIFGWKGFKETVIPSGMEKGSREHVFFITLALIVIDYHQNKKEQWLACKKAYENEKTRYLFIPEIIRATSTKRITEDLELSNLSQSPLQDARYIKRIASSMHLFFHSDPFCFLEDCNYEGEKVLNLIRSYRYRRGFPFLKSRKLAPVWLQFLYEQGGLPLKGIETFPLEVDSHIIRSTINCGAVLGSFKGSMSDLKNIIDGIWKEACQELHIYPLQLKEPLWYLGRFGCRSREGSSCHSSLVCPLQLTCLSHSQFELKDRVEILLNH